MNNKGQMVFFGFMLMVVIIVLAVGISHMLRELTDEGMTDMNCSSNTTILSTQAGCIVTDLTPAYFVLVLIGIGGLVLGVKALLG